MRGQPSSSALPAHFLWGSSSVVLTTLCGCGGATGGGDNLGLPCFISKLYFSIITKPYFPQAFSFISQLHWKDWCWSWNSNTLGTWYEELIHWKRPWCWESLKAGGEGDDRGWDGWMASPTQWTWVWVSSGREAWRAAVHGVAKSRTQLSDWTDWTEIPVLQVNYTMPLMSMSIYSNNPSLPIHPLALQSGTSGSQGEVTYVEDAKDKIIKMYIFKNLFLSTYSLNSPVGRYFHPLEYWCSEGLMMCSGLHSCLFYFFVFWNILPISVKVFLGQ